MSATPQDSATDSPPPETGIGRRRAAAKDENRAAYQERRSEIKAVAGRLFKQAGFRGTSLGQIAAALGMDRATLYYYIGSKEELFDEVVSEAVHGNVLEAEAIRDSAAPAPQKLRTLIECMMASYAKHYPYLYVYIQENLSHVSPQRNEWSQEMRRLNGYYSDIVIEIVQAGIEEGTIDPATDAWVMAYGILGMIGWTNRWFNPDKSPISAAEIGRAYADMLLNGMIPRPVTEN